MAEIKEEKGEEEREERMHYISEGRRSKDESGEFNSDDHFSSFGTSRNESYRANKSRSTSNLSKSTSGMGRSKSSRSKYSPKVTSTNPVSSTIHSNISQIEEEGSVVEEAETPKVNNNPGFSFGNTHLVEFEENKDEALL